MNESKPTYPIDTQIRAFPSTHPSPVGGIDVNFGMTLRDYFAAQALNGMLTDVRVAQLGRPMDGEPVEQFYAEGAYRFADAMLKAREQ